MRQVSLGEFVPALKETVHAGRAHSKCFEVDEGVVVHPLLKPGTVSFRSYQLNMALQVLDEGGLVVLPTGLGKTIVAVLAIADVLHHGKGKVLFLAPTKPLTQQHKESLERVLAEGKRMELFLGNVPPKKRQELWKEADIIFATPQGIANDLEKGRYGLEDVAMIIFDEAHRAVGDYDYVRVARNYMEAGEGGIILGLTASPGSEKLKIEEVRENLGRVPVAARTEKDPDVMPYVMETEIEYHEVTLTKEMERVRDKLERALDERVSGLMEMGMLEPQKRAFRPSKKDMVGLGDRIRKGLDSGEGDRAVMFKALKHQVIAFHLEICLELLETQGVGPFLEYLQRKSEEEEPSSYLKAFLSDFRVQEAATTMNRMEGDIHPKMTELVRVLEEQFIERGDSLVIVFSQSRDTIEHIMARLRGLRMRAERFVGQATRKGSKGLSQKEQARILERFREREFNVLVASSVAEEGLDIPAVDLVVFYEPIPEAIRTIQRRGRTGRNAVGKVAVLVTKGTRDAGYLKAEIIRERRMKGMVSRMARRR